MGGGGNFAGGGVSTPLHAMEILPDTSYEQTLELFLTEYPNSEMHRGKCCPSGYATSSKAIAQAKRKRGLTLTFEYRNDKVNGDGENKTAPKVIPGEDLTDKYSDDSSSEDSESD